MRRLIQNAKAHPYFTTSLVFTAAFGVASALCANRQIIINTSPSVAPGLYIRSNESLALGRLVDFHIPRAAAAYVRARTSGRTGGESWYILKPIAAGPGDDVDCAGQWLVINGRQVAPMPPRTDGSGCPLPAWREHRRMGPDEFFVFSGRIPNSFDSRCYGPINRGQVTAVRKPLWTW
jgi:conjugative transfer signal peptidase TraF